jgi:hypothetical protein
VTAGPAKERLSESGPPRARPPLSPRAPGETPDQAGLLWLRRAVNGESVASLARDGEGIRSLQRAAGNSGVTRLIKGSQTPRKLPEVSEKREFASEPGRTVQRRIGFEFEDRTWHPWKFDRGASQVNPVPRKHVLHAGTNFRLEADDTPGPAMSNIEFVTDPFDETATGVTSLVTALQTMRDIMGRIGPYKGLRGPAGAGPPFAYEGAWNYVTKGTHGLSGSNQVSADSLGLSGGSDRGQIKMQATMGLALEDIPRAMQTYGNVGPGEETQQETANRQPARGLQSAALYGTILGRSPGLALEAMKRIVRDANLSNTQRQALANATNLQAGQGYLSVVMMYLKSLQIPDNNEGAKSRVMFLARNRFSAMYAMLSPQVQALFATNHGNLLARHVLDVSNENPLLARVQGQLPDTNLTLNKPLINHVRVPQQGPMPAVDLPQQLVLAPFTTGAWLREVAVGLDSLSQNAMALTLANLGVGQGAATSASNEVLESFGEYNTDTTGNQELALFENRGISRSDITIDEAAKIAMNYLLHAALVKAGQNRKYPEADLP